MTDSFLSMDIVTASGASITASSTSHPDLFWAMRGAGQNFGIVTQFRYKIMDYPTNNNGEPQQDIFHATYHFTEEKLEVLFEYLNLLLNNGTLPQDINAYVVLRYKPHISPRVRLVVVLPHPAPHPLPI